MSERNFPLEKAMLTMNYCEVVYLELERLMSAGGAASRREVLDAQYQYRLAVLEVDRLTALEKSNGK